MKMLKPLCIFMCIVMLICSFPFYCSAESPAYSQLMEQEFGKKPHLKVPQRGDNVKLVELARKNAFEEAER